MLPRDLLRLRPHILGRMRRARGQRHAIGRTFRSMCLQTRSRPAAPTQHSFALRPLTHPTRREFGGVRRFDRHHHYLRSDHAIA